MTFRYLKNNFHICFSSAIRKIEAQVFQASLTRFHVLNITYATHENSFDDDILNSNFLDNPFNLNRNIVEIDRIQ